MAKIAANKGHVVFLLPEDTKEKYNTGKVYCYITRLDVLYIWNMQDLKQNKAPEGALSLPQAD